MQVSRSPMALWISTAATVESTPPESPQITPSSGPTCARILAIISSTTEAIFQSRARSKANLPDDAKLDVCPKERSVLERASRLFAGAESLTPLQQLMAAVPAVAEAPVVQSLVQGDTAPLAALPYALRVQ